ncbi:S9 family peptidase [Woeseia oceani]|uniref:S9 family peptidase n=1 Tax=Woeseia oceani TaxID=1548547 RepID=UPI000B0B0CC7|nr:S9 family peptidase [Woeseia oceani]
MNYGSKFLKIMATTVAVASTVLGACSQNGAEDNNASDLTKVPEFSARQFYETTSYSMVSSTGYAFAPDSMSLLVSSDASGVFNAWELPLDGGSAKALTHSDDNAIIALSWFPNDRRILYTFDGGGNELHHVAVLEPDGESRDLTPGDEHKAQFLRWSGNGEYFYLLTTERDQRNFDIYRYSASDYSREMVFENPGLSVGDISPDGRWVALEKPRTSADSDVYIVDLQADDAQPKLVTEHLGNVAHGVYSFTPDSANLVYSTNEHGEFTQAWTYNLMSEDKSELVSAIWDVSYVVYSPSGRYRVSGINADARTQVTMYDTETNEVLELPALPPGDLGSIRFADDETQIALLVNADNSPANVHVIDFAQRVARQLTDALNPAIESDYLVQSEVIRYPSFDGIEIPSILYKPHGASAENPVPALVWVHGGPGGQSRTGYNATRQHLVNHGYAILAANNRGSSGYGKTFFHLDDRKHGEEDLQDIVYGRKYLETLDWVDEDRIGIIGGSYGGYMVAAALAFEPEVFDVGINIFGVTNWVRTLQSIPPWWESFKEALFDEMGDPATDADRHRRISPLFHAQNIIKPLLVVQGANDPRVLQVESDELVAAVQKNEVPVEYVVFPDEGHGFAKRENRITASEAYVRFLDTWLKGKQTAD